MRFEIVWCVAAILWFVATCNSVGGTSFGVTYYVVWQMVRVFWVMAPCFPLRLACHLQYYTVL